MYRLRLAAAALLIFCIMSLFCDATPLVFDDYSYGSGGSGLGDLFAAQVAEHCAWSGKFIGHFMARVLLHGPSWLHSILSPLVFVALVFSGVVLTWGTAWRERIRAWQVILLAGLAWFALPAFGTVFFWRTGTPDYGYSLFFATAFLLPYRFWIDRKDYRPVGGAVCMLLGGILGGCSNENIGMLVFLLGLGVTVWRFRALKRIPLWAATGLAGVLGGWLFMMSAPGSALRLASIGGKEKIPVFSLEAFNRFLTFWGTQQLELAPYLLVGLVCVWLLHRQGKLRIATVLPGIIFFLMAQASLAAFLFSPSTPYRAMSATFFYQSCGCVALIMATESRKRAARLLFAVFCVLLAYSVLTEAQVFMEAQPAIARRDNARASGTLSAESFNYPKTDKYFFPTYDIIEIHAFRDRNERMIPWDKGTPLTAAGMSPVKALVISNMVYLSGLPQGKVHVAAVARQQTVASVIQSLVRRLAPSGATASTAEVAARYAVASATVTPEGRVDLHIPGVDSLDDIAYIGIRKNGKPLLWQRVTQ